MPAWRLRPAALPLFNPVQAPLVPVVARKSADTPPELRGALFHVDALKAYNRALATRAAEEHSWVCTDRAGSAGHPLSGPLAITV